MSKKTKIKLDEAKDLILASRLTNKDELCEQLEAFYELAEVIIKYDGSTQFEQLLVGNDIILVNGNLDVAGLIQDGQEVDSTMLIVLGDVKCKNLITLGSISIEGNLIVENAIMSDSLSDFELNVEGDIKCSAILECGHTIISGKRIHADYVFSQNNAIEDSQGAVVSDITENDLPVAMKEEGYYNLSKSIEYVKGNNSLLVKS